MQTQGSYYLRMLILGITAALGACLIALILATPPAQATHWPIDLSISQTDNPDPLEAGYLTYTLTVEQEYVCGGGCNSSGEVSVIDTLPSGVTLEELNYETTTPLYAADVTCTGTSTVSCTVGDLSDGESVKIDIVVKPTTAGAQTLTNTAVVSNVDGYPDPDTTNNSSTATTQVSESYTPPLDTNPPETTLTQKPETPSDDPSPRFSFTSNDPNATFECKIDAQTFQPCTSPKQLILLSDGRHTFQVRAKDASGNVDETPAQRTWTVDSEAPKVAFTQRPGTATGPSRYDEWVTNDRSPTWAWTVEDPNLDPDQTSCLLSETEPDYREVLDIEPCYSPYTYEAELPDGSYSFDLQAFDEAGNEGYTPSRLEVDTVAPKFVSGKPTGRRVSPYADVEVTFDDNVYGSARFVNIYKGGSDTPLAVYRYAYGNKKIEIDPKRSLRSDTRYTVKVTTGVNDGANNLEAPHSWSFKTRR